MSKKSSSPVSKFEALAEHLLEGAFSRMFAGRLHPLEVAIALARATEDALVVNVQGEQLAPNVYWLYLNPEDYAALQAAYPNLPQDLAQSAAQLVSQAGLLLQQLPAVEIHHSDKIPRRRVSAVARYIPPGDSPMGVTDQLSMPKQPAASPHVSAPPVRCYLILYGTRTVALQSSLVGLGRGLDNEVVIDDLRVSRHHAQLRQRFGRHVVYDLGSSGGTWVNGVRVSECMLSPGDVVSLGGFELIYGGDAPAQPSNQDTPAMEESRGEEAKR